MLTCLLGAGVAGAIVYAQIDGSERGVTPTDTTSNFEISGVSVDVAGKSADQARLRGWREAQRLAWRKLWQRTHTSAAPGLSDGALDSIVSGIVVEDEQIGPNRYIAKLGVLFDRVRTAQILGVAGSVARSAPLLLIPVQWSGGTPDSFEGRSEWQKAWARYRMDSSTIDYVRVAGTGADPLLLNVAQTGRPGRKWWRNLLDQYGAADVLTAQVRLERTYPGGPTFGHFTARYGPDNRILKGFSLKVGASKDIPSMMDEGVKRIDEIYMAALAAGELRPDQTLIIEQPVPTEELKKPEDDKDKKKDENKDDAKKSEKTDEEKLDEKKEDEATSGTASSISIQFDTPDAGVVSRLESTVRSVPGVKSASVGSIAIGGVSVMRVSFDGDGDMLRLALAARGLSVSGGGSSLRISAPRTRPAQKEPNDE
jgi:hypothetical protein